MKVILFYIIFVAIVSLVSLVIWRMQSNGEKFSSLVPRTRHERIRCCWLAIGALNLLAFIVHMGVDGTSAFPAGGRLVNGYYLVADRGRDVAFTPNEYVFSYWHGIIFVILHLVCMVAIWRLKTGDSKQ